MHYDQLLLLILSLLTVVTSHVSATLNPPRTVAKTLSRKRRYVAFPEGSSLSAAICMTTGVLGNPNVAFLSWAENWGVAYELPNQTWARAHAAGFKRKDPKYAKPVVQRRSRRDLYGKIETIIENMGFDGRACISRALCENAKYLRHFRRQRGNMIEEIVKTIFSFPQAPVHSHEPHDVHRYDHIYRRARRQLEEDCSMLYPQCRFSLLELAFGKYSVAPTRHGTPAHIFM